MVLQVIAQVIDGHAVEAGRPFVAPDTSQRLPQITGIDDRLHRRSQPGCRAFGFGVRRAGFGPLVSGAPGFTPRLRLQGQFKLDIPPLGPHERTVLLTLSVVQAFVGKPTVGSEEAPRGADLRPPLKRPVQFSRRPLSQRCLNEDSRKEPV